MTGRFITVEGGEGSGKSTFVKGLSERLNAFGIPTLVSREPGGSDEAERIRALIVQGDPHRFDALEEVLLLNAARRHHIRTVVQPALESGLWVICDRFFDSTLVYQGYTKNVDLKLLQQMHDTFCFGLVPDHSFILDVSVQLGLSRTDNRQEHQNENRFEQCGDSFHSIVRNSFLELSNQSDRFTVMSTDTSSKEEIVTKGWAILKSLFVDKN